MPPYILPPIAIFAMLVMAWVRMRGADRLNSREGRAQGRPAVDANNRKMGHRTVHLDGGL